MNNETIRIIESECKLMDEVIRVYHLNPETGRYGKKPYYNVRINNEIHQMWFGTKRAAKAYLAKHSWKKLILESQNE